MFKDLSDYPTDLCLFIFIKVVSAFKFKVLCKPLLSPLFNQLLCFLPGTDVMLLDNFSTDGSSHPQHHGNLSGKRRSSVTFEDQVEHSKGICHVPTSPKVKEEGAHFVLTGSFEKGVCSQHVANLNIALHISFV